MALRDRSAPRDRSALREQAVRTRQRLEQERGRHRALDVALRSLQLHHETGGGLLAGALAFRYFLFLVPGTFVVVMGLGLGADAVGTDPQEVARRLGIAGLAATAIQSGAQTDATTRWVTFGIALVAFLAGARNLLKTLLVVHALLWRTPLPRLRRPLTAAAGLVVTVVAVTTLLALAYRLRELSLLGAVAALALYTLVPTAVWLLASLRLFPTPPGVTWRDAWPGAVLLGAGMEGLHLVTVLWVAPSMSAKSEAYGALGAALTILFWAYLLGWLVTSAAALNAVLWQGSPRNRGAVSPVAHDVGPTPPGGASGPGAR